MLVSPKKGIAAIETDFTEITVYGNKILWEIRLNSQEGCEKPKVSASVYNVVGHTVIMPQLLELGVQRQQLI